MPLKRNLSTSTQGLMALKFSSSRFTMHVPIHHAVLAMMSLHAMVMEGPWRRNKAHFPILSELACSHYTLASSSYCHTVRG